MNATLLQMRKDIRMGWKQCCAWAVGPGRQQECRVPLIPTCAPVLSTARGWPLMDLQQTVTKPQPLGWGQLPDPTSCLEVVPFPLITL